MLRSIKKRYSPVRIRDPIKAGHMVRLCPNQDVIVSISSPAAQDAVVYCDTFAEQYMSLASEEMPQDGCRIWRFSPTRDLTRWSKISDIHIGEIFIENGGTCASLYMIVGAPKLPKSEVLTVENPRVTTIRILPQQILEVVLCDPALSPALQWDCTIYGGAGDTIYEKIGYEIMPHSTEVSFTDIAQDYRGSLLSVRRSEHKCPEHHFWFRLTSDSVKEIMGWPTDDYYGGMIMFVGKKDNRCISCSMRQIDLKLHVSGKSKQTAFKSQLCGIPTKPKTSMALVPLPNMEYDVYDLTDYRYDKIPKMQNVTLELVEDATLFSGCKVLVADPKVLMWRQKKGLRESER